MKFREGNLEIDFTRGKAKKFDGENHRLSHCKLKAVDFIVELEDKIIFIEVTDPDQAPVKKKRKIIEDLKNPDSEQVWELVVKCRDTFLYEWCAEKISKPIYFIALLCIEQLDAPMLTFLTDNLKSKLPIIDLNKGIWSRNFIIGCSVWNVRKWNDIFTFFPIERVL